MLTPVESIADEQEIEIYLSRSLGLALLAIAVLVISLSGLLPLTSPTDAISVDETDTRAPYATSTLLITTLLHGVLAFYNYTCYVSSSQTAVGLGMVGSAIVASTGIWCLLFGTSKPRISSKTGADKRTSGFPFKNAEADKRRTGRKQL